MVRHGFRLERTDLAPVEADLDPWCRLTRYLKTGVEIHKFVSDLIYYPHRSKLKVEKTDLTLTEFDFGLAEIHDVHR